MGYTQLDTQDAQDTGVVGAQRARAVAGLVL